MMLSFSWKFTLRFKYYCFCKSRFDLSFKLIEIKCGKFNQSIYLRLLYKLEVKRDFS